MDMSTEKAKFIIPKWLKQLNFVFSRKGDGQMSFKRADPITVTACRMKFLRRNGLDLGSVVAGELVHSSAVAVVGMDDRGRGSVKRDWIEGVDGLVTADPHVLLLTTHADCAPIVIYDPVHYILGQAHAGWRGLVAGMVTNLVKAVCGMKGIDPNYLQVWIGPMVHSCCYPVSDEVAEQFPTECRLYDGGLVHLDLVRFIKLELKRLGIHRNNITDADICTSCEPEYSSFRRDGTAFTAMACVTGLA